MPQELSQFEEKLIRNVGEHGCQVNHVFDPEGKNPDFSYSIGFPTSVQQPEIIIFGLRREVMHFMINEMLAKLRDGLKLHDWSRIDGLLQDHSCIAREIPAKNISSEYFGSAIWFQKHLGGEGLSRAFQIVWPGTQDRLFPWETGAHKDVIESQTRLYEEAVH